MGIFSSSQRSVIPASGANRDVYTNQQLERSTMSQHDSNATLLWIAGGAFIIFIAAILGYFLLPERHSALDSYPDKYSYLHMEKRDGERMFTMVDENGSFERESAQWFADPCQVPTPQWYIDEYGVDDVSAMVCLESIHDGTISWAGLRAWFIMVAILIVAFWIFVKFKARGQKTLSDARDINQHEGDQHIAVPEEVMDMFDFFPDAGAHAPVHVSSLISHVALDNKGINKVDVTRRVSEDVFDEDGDVDLYAGEAVLDDEGEVVTDSLPMFNTDFMEELFDTSGLPRNTKQLKIRKYFDPRSITYNPDGLKRDKAKFATVADLINGTWELPEYETQRPAGAYLVDTAPVNTMLIAMTRAGKGQTMIEPTIDMWTREKSKHNMIVNDPKGELLLKFFVPATIRGFHVVQFNLINEMKTDVYNPLGIAAAAARDGDIDKCALTVGNIADVFFPVDGADDPVWPNAANNAFKRAAYALIDFYLEEENNMRRQALRRGEDIANLEVEIDQMWSKVTLYNCYQFFVRLASVKKKNPLLELKAKKDSGAMDWVPQEAISDVIAEANERAAFWQGSESIDLLTLYFNATKDLPKNALRQLLAQVDDSLRSMAQAEKMLASVYGIAITAMSFFTEPTIAALTSGSPKQNVDLSAFAFPRCFGVRFMADYMDANSYIGQKAVWDAFADPNFTEPLDRKVFGHDDTVKRNGWTYYYFEGIFPEDTVYVRLRIRHAKTNHVLDTYWFEFTKSYQTSFDGLTYMRNEVSGERIVKGGVMREMVRAGDGFVYGSSVFSAATIAGVNDIDGDPHIVHRDIGRIRQFYVRYEEKPKALFLVTPPSRLSYAKIILILIKQLFDVSVEQSYVAKPSQKPLVENRFMLDELGNLQNEGNGIPGLETMLSIGAGQGQAFTLILQTLQQLIAVYGADIDKIIQGNTSNIVFLKSTDDSMLQTLEKMSGTRHVSYVDQKTVTVDKSQVLLKNDSRVAYVQSTVEEPVIKYNDMAFIPERNSMVFRAGTPPIWNRNETILPMAWKLHQRTITNPGHKYTMQTVPTNSSAIDFDVRTNQPDFFAMVNKRIEQAIVAKHACDIYQYVHNYSDHDLALVDPDTYAEEVMTIVSELLSGNDVDVVDEFFAVDSQTVDRNDSLIDEVNQLDSVAQDAKIGRFAGGTISRQMLVEGFGTGAARVLRAFDEEIVSAYSACIQHFAGDPLFVVREGELFSHDGVPFIVRESERNASVVAAAAADPNLRVFSEEGDVAGQVRAMMHVTSDFYVFLASCEAWDFARGAFDMEMCKATAEKM